MDRCVSEHIANRPSGSEIVSRTRVHNTLCGDILKRDGGDESETNKKKKNKQRYTCKSSPAK